MWFAWTPPPEVISAIGMTGTACDCPSAVSSISDSRLAASYPTSRSPSCGGFWPTNRHQRWLTFNIRDAKNLRSHDADPIAVRDVENAAGVFIFQLIDIERDSRD